MSMTKHSNMSIVILIKFKKKLGKRIPVAMSLQSLHTFHLFSTQPKWEPLTTADVTTANVSTADVTTANVSTANVNTADVTTADVTTANVTTADVLVLGYGLWVRVWVMVRVTVWVRP